MRKTRAKALWKGYMLLIIQAKAKPPVDHPNLFWRRFKKQWTMLSVKGQIPREMA